MTIETDEKIRLLRETIAEIESRIQLIDCNDDVDCINKGHLETLIENVRLMVIDLTKLII